MNRRWLTARRDAALDALIALLLSAAVIALPMVVALALAGVVLVCGLAVEKNADSGIPLV
jgi:hypothetical protein